MNSETHLQRAQLLMQQHRLDQAIEQLHQALVHDPDLAEAHALLALCLADNQDRWHDATREAEKAIHLAPDKGFTHYAHAVVLSRRNHIPEALQSITEAIRLEPQQSSYFGIQGSLLLHQEQWQAALHSADQGLECDPEDQLCASIRSLALERLGRTQDALAEANRAVSRDADSASAHASRGWALLNKGIYTEAQLAFREALRLDPTDQFARSGMIQALNSNHLLFRWMFQFYSFVGRLSSGMQWALILGLFFGNRLIRAISDVYPVLAPWTLPITILYISFCLLSWIADPLFNTFLRFHPFGKYLLSNKEKLASNIIASIILIGLVGAFMRSIHGDFAGALTTFLCPMMLTMPIALAFSVDRGWPTWTATSIAVLLSVLCFAAIVLIALNSILWISCFAGFAVGILVTSFLGNWLRGVTVRH